MASDPFAYGVLKKDVHNRLVADLEGYATDAGIQPHWIYTPLPDTITVAELNWLRDFRKHTVNGTCAGIAYTGKTSLTEIVQRMSLLTGALVRNFIRARVTTLGQVHDMLAGGAMPDLKCLAISNFYIGKEDGGHIAPWQSAALLDCLISRQMEGPQTILYVQDLNQLAKDYGTGFRDLITAHYLQIGL